jgi:membrane-associated phospholipid phosphatase
VQLRDLDMKWFGIEPAFYFDRFVNASSTEWFAFFYYSYFFLIAGHLLPILFFGKHPLRTAQFLLGILLVSVLGQSIYVFVPGYGPHKAFADTFTNALPEGLWWRIVLDLVAQGGAQKDIFPSLHTAVPTYILLFSYHYRDSYPYRLTWHLVAVFVVNIVIATMFLRWHYFVDVIAGLILACGAYMIGIAVPVWERRRRLPRGHGEIWPEYSGP